jgi:hypothetical protein
MKFDVDIISYKLCSKNEFRKNRLSDTCTLLEGVSELYSALPILVFHGKMRLIRHKISSHNTVAFFSSFVEMSTVKAVFYLML